jgi:transposase
VPKVREVTVHARGLHEVVREISLAKIKFKLPETAKVVSCYEAGGDGFWIHRWLQEQGVENFIVDSASIERSQRARKAKTDRLDGKKLAEMLRRYVAGEEDVWSVVRVPDPESEDLRRLQREADRLKKEHSAHIVRIRALLKLHGLQLEPEKAVKDLENLRSPNGDRLRRHTCMEIQREWTRVELLRSQLQEIRGERRRLAKECGSQAMRKILILCALQGVGEEGAWTLVTEYFGWRTFNNRRAVGSLAGLTGTPFSSGTTDREQGISKSGSRRVRSLLTELAWLWIRYQPRSKITRWFNQRYHRGTKRMRRVGIVALARKLLIALWRWVEFGEIPEGAILSRKLSKPILNALGAGWPVRTPTQRAERAKAS